jgi:cell division protease FtsH
VVGYLLPNSDPIRKVTIIPRGMSGGSTLFVPEQDMNFVSRSRLKDQIVVALAGRAAEEIIFNEITTGATGDLEHVTKLARAMVTRFGMSDKLGPMMFGQKEEMIFLGRDIAEQRDYSEAVAEQIDGEVRGIVNWAYSEARRLIVENRALLDRLAERLLEVETIDSDEFLSIMKAAETTPPDHHQSLSSATAAHSTDDPAPQEKKGVDRRSMGTAPSLA